MTKRINISESRVVSALMAVMPVFVLCSCTKEEAAERVNNKTEPQYPTGINLSPAWADTIYYGFTVDATWGGNNLYTDIN